jgi:hypothetical protein
LSEVGYFQNSVSNVGAAESDPAEVESGEFDPDGFDPDDGDSPVLGNTNRSASLG